LLFLSILNSTGLVTFKTPAIPTDATINKHLIPLAQVAIFLSSRKDVKTSFPSFLICEDTYELDTIDILISSWNEIKESFSSIERKIGEDTELKREASLNRLMRSQGKNLVTYAKRLADWVSIAASFPTYEITREDALGGIERITCAQHWKEVIISCGDPNLNVWKINKGDIQDILDHLENNLELGTSYSNAIFRLLEKTIDRQDNFLGIDIDAPYTILSATSTNGTISEGATQAQIIEDNAILSLINDAPKELPIQSAYPSKVAYLRALGKWNTAQRYFKEHPEAVQTISIMDL